MKPGRSLLLALVLVAAAAVPGVAQTEQPPLEEDPIFRALYSPELIMQHRRAIGLTDEQRDAISQMIRDLQGRVVQLQWEMLDEVQQLVDITARQRVDLDEALDQIESVLDIEKDVKLAHLEMLVRIKNLLTPEQQVRLDELRGGAPPG